MSSEAMESGAYAGLILGRCGFQKKMGVRGFTPSKTHHFLPICKQHNGNFCKFSWFFIFFSFFFLDFFSYWLLGVRRTPSHPPAKAPDKNYLVTRSNHSVQIAHGILIGYHEVLITRNCHSFNFVWTSCHCTRSGRFLVLVNPEISNYRNDCLIQDCAFILSCLLIKFLKPQNSYSRFIN